MFTARQRVYCSLQTSQNKNATNRTAGVLSFKLRHLLRYPNLGKMKKTTTINSEQLRNREGPRGYPATGTNMSVTM